MILAISTEFSLLALLSLAPVAFSTEAIITYRSVPILRSDGVYLRLSVVPSSYSGLFWAGAGIVVTVLVKLTTIKSALLSSFSNESSITSSEVALSFKFLSDGRFCRSNICYFFGTLLALWARFWAELKFSKRLWRWMKDWFDDFFLGLLRRSWVWLMISFLFASYLFFLAGLRLGTDTCPFAAAATGLR